MAQATGIRREAKNKQESWNRNIRECVRVRRLKHSHTALTVFFVVDVVWVGWLVAALTACIITRMRDAYIYIYTYMRQLIHVRLEKQDFAIRVKNIMVVASSRVRARTSNRFCVLTRTSRSGARVAWVVSESFVSVAKVFPFGMHVWHMFEIWWAHLRRCAVTLTNYSTERGRKKKRKICIRTFSTICCAVLVSWKLARISNVDYLLCIKYKLVL